MSTTTAHAKNIMLYGESGLGKTTNAVQFAKLMYELTRKPVRLITAEASSQTLFEPLIKLGVVLPFFLPSASSPLAYFKALRSGAWPVEGSKWQTWKEGAAGSYIIEGATSIPEVLLEELRERGLLLREQKSDAFEIDGHKFSPSSQSAYGFAQSEMLAAFKEFASLPGVERVLWTGHETKGVDPDTKQAIIGPALVGSAKTAHVQKYVGMLLHVENYPMTHTLGVKEKDVRGSEKALTAVSNVVRVWYERHGDVNNPSITYPAKTTIPTAMLPKLWARYPNKYFTPVVKDGVLTDHLGDFLRFEMSLVDEQTALDKAWKEEVDGK